MKIYVYIALLCIQAALSIAAGIFRRQSWSDATIDGQLLPSIDLSISNWLIISWAVSVIIATLLCFFDKKNKAIIFLFLVLIFPSLELLWLLVGYAL